jgi:hypothetical protein
MLPPSFSFKAMIRSARWLGLVAMVAALPLSLAALPVTPVTVGFTFTLDGDLGSVVATYNSSATPLTDSTGTYVDASDGLLSFTVTWDENTYTMPEALESGELPELFLPGNTLVASGGYGFLGDWLVSGTIGTNAEILGVGANVPAYLAEDVTEFAVNGTPSTMLNLGLDDKTFISGTALTTIPEPAMLSALAFGLAGLWWFARRRKAIL